MVRNCAPRMETTLYDEQFHKLGHDMNQMKRNLTLDLNSSRGPAKKMKFNPAVNAAPVLSSPDLNMLKLGSPELEKLIIQQGGLVTTTPTPTTQILFPKTVTEEQELYARGFVEALNVLHNSDSSQSGMHSVDLPVTTAGVGTCSGGGITYTNLDHSVVSSAPAPTPAPGVGVGVSAFHLQNSGAGSGFGLDSDVVIKDEPQTVPSLGSTPPMSPIDMETQERIKLERKRMRNRVAASKCRRRKLERISRLEDKVKMLKGENSELSSVVNKLKEHVCHLKEQVMEHVEAGCQIVISQQF